MRTHVCTTSRRTKGCGRLGGRAKRLTKQTVGDNGHVSIIDSVQLFRTASLSDLAETTFRRSDFGDYSICDCHWIRESTRYFALVLLALLVLLDLLFLLGTDLLDV